MCREKWRESQATREGRFLSVYCQVSRGHDTLLVRNHSRAMRSNRTTTIVLVILALIVLASGISFAVVRQSSVSKSAGNLENVESLPLNPAPQTDRPLPATSDTDDVSDEDSLTLVKFCGKDYYAKEVIINGVNVVQRIGEFASKRPSSSPCLNLNAVPAGSILEVTQMPEEKCRGEDIVCLLIAKTDMFFIVNSSTMKVYVPGFPDSQFYGDLLQP